MKTAKKTALFLLCVLGNGVATLPALAAQDTVQDAAKAAAKSQVKPKYGEMATRLEDSHEYLRKNPAPDFWALISYYLPQRWEGACSLASVAMVVNAARVHDQLTADDKLATQAELLEKVKKPIQVAGGERTWAQAVGADNIKLATGTSLDQLGMLVEESLKAYGVQPKRVIVEHLDGVTSADKAKDKAKLHATLLKNEKSDGDFVIANFIQGVYTGDADAGHIAPVGAYDAAKKRVLVLDPDREWYEPYWVSEETFFAGMNTPDKSSGHNRGYVWVQLR